MAKKQKSKKSKAEADAEFQFYKRRFTFALKQPDVILGIFVVLVGIGLSYFGLFHPFKKAWVNMLIFITTLTVAEFTRQNIYKHMGEYHE